MKRVFPRKGLQLLCQRCAEKGIRETAVAQNKDKALCWDCFHKWEEEQANYKQRLADRFNEILGTEISMEDEYDEDDLEEFLEEFLEENEDEQCH